MASGVGGVGGRAVDGAGAPEEAGEPGAGQAGPADGAEAAPAAAPVRGTAPVRMRSGGMTALQKHAAYFDLDKDGMVSVKETDTAMRALGLAGISSRPTALAINVGLGRATSGKLLDVSVMDIAKGMHPGDSGVLDKSGNFVPEKFDALWRTFDADKDGALNQAEVDRLIEKNTAGAGARAVVASRGEWLLLMDLAGRPDARGQKVIRKEDLKAFYDGTLFPRIAAERAAAAAKAGTDPLHGDVNAGIAGLARNFAGILAGSAAGAKAAELLTWTDGAHRPLQAPLAGAMLVACPALKNGRMP